MSEAQEKRENARGDFTRLVCCCFPRTRNATMDPATPVYVAKGAAVTCEFVLPILAAAT